MVETALHQALVVIRCEMVWSATSFPRATTSGRSLESSRLGKFECEISPEYDLRQKKLWLSIIPARRPSEQPSLGPPPKRCELQLIAGIRQAVQHLKAFHLGRLNMHFSRIGQKIQKLQLFQLFGGKLRKISLDCALWCGSWGIDNFLCPSSLGSTSIESCQLSDLKYAIFSRTGCKTKK